VIKSGVKNKNCRRFLGHRAAKHHFAVHLADGALAGRRGAARGGAGRSGAERGGGARARVAMTASVSADQSDDTLPTIRSTRGLARGPNISAQSSSNLTVRRHLRN